MRANRTLLFSAMAVLLIAAGCTSTTAVVVTQKGFYRFYGRWGKVSTDFRAEFCIQDHNRISCRPIKVQFEGATGETLRKGFRDTVILRDGRILTGVQASALEDSVVVVHPDGTTEVFEKEKVQSIQKGAGD